MAAVFLFTDIVALFFAAFFDSCFLLKLFNHINNISIIYIVYSVAKYIHFERGISEMKIPLFFIPINMLPQILYICIEKFNNKLYEKTGSGIVGKHTFFRLSHL